MNRRIVAVAGLVASGVTGLLAGRAAHAVPPRVDFWPAPAGREYRVDVEQLSAIDGSHVQVLDGAGAGQTFVAGASSVARIDLTIGSMGDGRPGGISLYRWLGEYSATVAAKPLWSDGVDLSGADTLRRHSFRPEVAVEAGATYFVELTAAGRGPYRVWHTMGKPDAYRAGALHDRSGWRKGWDLWFRVFSSAGDAVSESVAVRPPLDTRVSQLPAAPPLKVPRITRRSYYNRIARHANIVRPSMMNSCGRKGDEMAMLEGFLYRASCEDGKCKEVHARYVRDLYRDTYAWRSCAPGSTLPPVSDPRSPRCADVCQGAGVDWNPMRRATTAYLWTRESTAYTEADHELIRAQLANLGRRLWEKRELGTHNRAMQYLVTYRVLSDLLPSIPEAKQWRAYSDRLWLDFLESGDMREDSTEYASVAWWPAVLEYLAVTGQEAEAFADPRFRSLVERAYQLMTPLGPAADLGNSVGFGRDSAGFIWLFEAAAHHYREPRFREAARRAFGFHSGSVRDRQPREDALDQTLGALAWAYFAVDESVAAALPPALTEEAMNLPVSEATQAWAVAANVVLGQRFSLASAPLVGIELRSLGGDAKRAELTLWRWRGDLERTRSEPPMFRDESPVAANGAIEVFPYIDAPTGTELYFEARALEGALRLAGSSPAPGAQAASTLTGLVDSNGASPGANLWFRANTLTGLGSTVTWRRPVRERPRSLQGPRPNHTYDFGEGQVPDKLVLRSGFAEDDFFAVLNLVHRFGHGEAEQGALVAVVDGGSLLLQDGPVPYWSHQAQRQNETRPHVQRYSGGTLATEGSPTEVEHFRDARASTVVRLRYDEPGGWGAKVERRIFFAKDRFLFIRDCFQSPEELRASIGTLWHPTDVAEPFGENWFDVFVRSPLANVYRVRNKPRRMLVYFVPRADAEVEAFLEPTYLPEEGCSQRADEERVRPECRIGPPYVLSQRRTGALDPGQQRCFDTLLVPHDVAEPEGELARNVRVLHSDDATVALELQLGDERWLVVDDTSDSGVHLPDLDARVRYAIVRAEPDSTPYVFASDALQLRWRGVEAEWSVPVSLETGARPGRREPQ